MSFSPIKTRFNDSCPVCYNELTDEDTTFKNCKHGICRNCFSQLRTDNCPLCREPIPQKTECLLPTLPFVPSSSPISNWTRRHPRRRRRRRRWDSRRSEQQVEETKDTTQTETKTETKEHVEDRERQKRRAKFQNGKKKKRRRFKNSRHKCNLRR